MEIQPLGDNGILLSFENEISESIHHKIQQFLAELSAAKIPGIMEWVPAYQTIVIYYQPEIISFQDFTTKIKGISMGQKNGLNSSPIIYEIPVFYGAETGPDLPFIAEYHGISVEEAIAYHSRQEYLIYMMGFVPGFPYLGGLPQQLAVPRLTHPRARVAAGSVGIGGSQTGIYPAEVPSGWRIIGITPVRLFDLHNSSPVLLSAGHYVKFYPISKEEYLDIKRLIEQKRFKVNTYKKGEYKC